MGVNITYADGYDPYSSDSSGSIATSTVEELTPSPTAAGTVVEGTASNTAGASVVSSYLTTILTCALGLIATAAAGF